jgi:hypothetical protein
MNMNRPGSKEELVRARDKWNYVFIESLKMALFLPLVILFTEIFILDTWPELQENPIQLIYDYLFLFSMIFLIFTGYHLLRWRKIVRKNDNATRESGESDKSGKSGKSDESGKSGKSDETG